MTFGQRFKELRIEKGLKQQELADDFNNIYNHNFAKSSISQYENGKRTPETEALKNFASYFNVSIDYLLGVSNDRGFDKEDTEISLKQAILFNINNFFKDNDISRQEKQKLFKELSSICIDSLE